MLSKNTVWYPGHVWFCTKFSKNTVFPVISTSISSSTEFVGIIGEEERTQICQELDDRFDIWQLGKKKQQGVIPFDRKDVGSVTILDFKQVTQSAIQAMVWIKAPPI